MPTIGVRIVYAGNGSVAGQVYIVFRPDSGPAVTYGKYPISNLNSLGGRGLVIKDLDNDNHESRAGAAGINGVPNVSFDFPVSQSDYDRVLSYADDAANRPGVASRKSGYYNPIIESCVDFAWDIFEQAGLSLQPGWDGYLLPSSNYLPFKATYYKYFRRAEFNREARRVPLEVNTSFRQGNANRPRDPLAIDLDGDGIETAGVAGCAILFDHNADGVKTGTGWVRADDAWLVLDRNGNGLIDSGRELFGVDTLLSGAVGVDAVFARSGFEALRALDTGSGQVGSAGADDGVFNVEDSAFSQVRLWQDLNQDGISQVNELFTLAQKNIRSISLVASNATINLGNGNSISGTAVVTRTSGVDTMAGTVAVSADTTAANLNLGVNPFHREFATTIALTDQAIALPEMQGSGWVRDLREAMSLGNTQSDALLAIVQTFATSTTRDGQTALIDEVLRLWAQTHQTAAAGPRTDPLRRFVLSGDLTTSLQLQAALPVLEVFNGQSVVEAGIQAPSIGVDSDGRSVFTYAMFGAQASLMLVSYALLRESVYSSLVLQSRLARYLNAMELVLDESGISFDTSGLHTALEQRKSESPRDAMWDLVELNRYAGAMLLDVNYDGLRTLRQWTQELAPDAPLRAEFASMNVWLANTVPGGTVSDDIYLGDDGHNVFNALTGNDLLDGGNGSDILSGGDGNDLLFGAAGADALYGGDGDDMLQGGAGNDTLNGGLGNNVYLFGPGDGQDVIDYYSDLSASKFNVLRFKPGIKAEQISVRRVFDADFTRADVNNAMYSSLELVIAGTTDKITVRGVFDYDNPGNQYNPLQGIEFADGTVWGLSEIVARTLQSTDGADALRGTPGVDLIQGGDGIDTISGGAGDDILLGDSGNDSISGDSGNDRLYGGDGNDALAGGDGDDLLYGGSGADSLSGGNGADTLEGGAGNDRLHGGLGNNVYLFGPGDGQDLIDYYSDLSAGKFNVLRFKPEIKAEQISARRVFDADFTRPDVNNAMYSSLELVIAGTTDKITVRGVFDYDNPGNQYNPLQSIEFADGTVWGVSEIVARTLQSTDGADALRGTFSANVIRGGNGRDTIGGGSGDDDLYGDADNDVLIGDGGNDRLWGGAGDDQLRGELGNDKLYGNDGNDVLSGDASSEASSATRIVSLSVVARGSACQNIWPTMEVWVAGARVQSFQVESTEFKTYAVTAPLGLDATSVDFVFANDAYRPDLGQDRNLYLDRIEVNGRTISARDVGAIVDYGVSGSAFDGLNTAASNGSLGSNGAIRVSLLGSDLLDGGAGVDTMTGGVGNDIYIVDNIADVVYEYAHAGHDIVRSSVSYTLPSHVEDLELTGTSSINAIGNAAQNTLRGNSAANRLDGGAGADMMVGNGGNDIYIVDNLGDIVYEVAGDGIDTVFSSVSHTLRAEVENLSLAGLAAIDGSGNNLANILLGNMAGNSLSGAAGDDTLYGEQGSDRLYGGDGNDILWGDSATDFVRTERVDSLVIHARGTVCDGVWPTMQVWIAGVLVQSFAVSSTTFTAYQVTSPLGVDASSADIVFGNDAYRSDLGQDRNLYLDRIEVNGRSLGALSAGVVLDYGSGAAAFDGINTAASWGGISSNGALRFGLAGADLLDGGSGADLMHGGIGNDLYMVDNVLDRVVEQADSGHDIVRASVSYHLPGHVEDLELTGTSAIAGTGNAAQNTLRGNAAANRLDGGAGSDLLVGGAGGDTYVLGRGYGSDSVYEYDSTPGSVDTALFDGDIAAEQLWFRRLGSSLEISVIGTTDKLGISGWYSGSGYRIEQLKSGDGRTLLESQVQSLVDAMAAFAPPPMGQMQLSPAYANALNPTIAANWH